MSVEKFVENLKLAAGLLTVVPLLASVGRGGGPWGEVGQNYPLHKLTCLDTISCGQNFLRDPGPRTARALVLSACHTRPFPAAFWRSARRAKESRNVPGGLPAKKR